jgi:glutamyl-tRNA reductase
MPVLALGVSYRRAPVELLERMTIPQDEEPKAYGRLAGLESIEESVILSTCNRVEVYAEVPLYHQGFQDLKRFLTDQTEVPVEELAEPLYSHYEDHAAEHLFSVAAGLDSMVLGEPQILVQVRGAFRRAQDEAASGPALTALFQQAVRAGRRVRNETGLGSSPGAFLEAGAVLAQEHLGDLAGLRALIVGAGEMGSLAARTLRERRVGDLVVLSRRPQRAERLAARVKARHGSFEDLPVALRGVDLVVSSTGATGPVITAETLGASRAGGALFILDLGVPRDVHPDVAALPGIRLADIDDLREVLTKVRGDIADETAAARAIVSQETLRYGVARRSRRLAPLIEALHARGEAVRAEEIARLASRLASLAPKERETVELLTGRIVKRLLHDPTVRLKDMTGRGQGDAPARALADLFGLELDEG